MDRTVIIYDANCGFCRWSLSKILSWDRHHSLRPVPLQSEEADKLLDGMDPETKMRSWHLVTPDGMIYSEGAAVPPLAKLLPGGRPIASLASTLPGTTTRLYRWVADHRDRLARLVGPQRCSVDPAKRQDPQP
jgi:predicted DCC family thiol-disulfide oxidoreductase YuxK